MMGQPMIRLTLFRTHAARDERIRFLSMNTNSGPAAAANLAIDQAQGDWIAILDADDWYAPQRLETLLGIARSSRSTVVADNQRLYDAKAAQEIGYAFAPFSGYREIDLEEVVSRAQTGRERFDFGMLKLLIRRDLILQSGIRYEGQFRSGHDFPFLFELLMKVGKLALAGNAYYFYRQPFGTISRQPSHSARQQYRFEELRRANELLIERHNVSLSAKLRSLLEKRGRSIVNFARYLELKDRITANGDYRAIIKMSFNPSIAPFTARALARRATAKLGVAPYKIGL